MTKTNSLHFRLLIKDTGYTSLVSPTNSPLRIISLDLLRMNAGDSYTFLPDTSEKVLVVLSGTYAVSTDEYAGMTIGERRSVFDGPASALYLPPQHKATLKAETRAEVAVARAPSTISGLQPRVIQPTDVRERVIGRDNWLRNVYGIVEGEFPADRLIVGETINPPGNWSSTPPHKHDRHNPPYESQFEEIYFYRVDPPQGFGLQRVYTAEGDLDTAYVVQQNDLVVLPRGYHPVVACPGYRLYYLWVLAGRGRDPVWFEDPEHSWINRVG